MARHTAFYNNPVGAGKKDIPFSDIAETYCYGDNKQPFERRKSANE